MSLPNQSVPTQQPPVGRLYQVLERRLFLDRAGNGGPPVVWLPGAGMFGLGYYNVHQAAAGLTTSVVYDRAGTGWSDPIELPRSMDDVVDELRALLEVAGIRGPYLLAGHSLGGLYARRFAQRFPAEVVGLLLLDPASEDFRSHLSDQGRQFLDGFKDRPPMEFTPEVINAFRPIIAGMYADWPDEIREALIQQHLIRAPVGLEEGKNVEELYEQIRRGPPISGIPLIVYTAMAIDASQRMFSPEEIIRDQNAAKLAANEDLVRSTPGAENRVLEDASHAMLHGQRPDAVIQGIRDLLARIPPAGGGMTRRWCLGVILLATGLVARVTSLQAQQPASDPNAKCAALGGVDYSRTPDAVIQILATANIEASNGRAGYCEVAGYVAPNVGFALRLPSDHWNGKFLELGCGGACGFTAHVAGCEEPLRRGYACIVSDGGHKARGDVKWAFNNSEAVTEYFVRASHVTAIAGKVIAESYYHQAPEKSYFMGCSAGGLQGTMEAERFPWDFDGIVVGAPSLSLTGLWLNLVWANRAITDPAGDPRLGAAELATLHDAVVASCDLNDGVKDGLIGDPRSCGFQPSELLCRAGKTSGCLTAPQVEAVTKIYGGPVTSKGVQIVVPSVPKGSELTWLELLTGSTAKPNPTFNYFIDWARYYLFQPNPGPTWEPKDFDFDHDYQRLGMAEVTEPINSPDLRRFKARGGKLLSYMGWSDAIGGVLATTDFYQTAERVIGSRAATRDFYRLFMVPDMYHCGSGPGASTVDWLSYLEGWVERGQPPSEIVGSHVKAAGPMGSSGSPFPMPAPDPAQVTFRRPAYPFPTIAKYRGRGDPNDPASFHPVEP